MTWSPLPEMMWKTDPEVEAACKMPGWKEFHRECGKQKLFFDHIERHGGKRGEYVAVAFTAHRRPTCFVTEKLSEGRGKTVIAAIANAYEAASIIIAAPDAEPWLMKLRRPDAPPEPSVAALLDDIEDLLG